MAQLWHSNLWASGLWAPGLWASEEAPADVVGQATITFAPIGLIAEGTTERNAELTVLFEDMVVAGAAISPVVGALNVTFEGISLQASSAVVIIGQVSLQFQDMQIYAGNDLLMEPITVEIISSLPPGWIRVIQRHDGRL